MKCHFKAARGTRVTDDTIALHLYRIAQEALKNALKHSGAKNILITLDRNSEHVCVSVEDDGSGFSPRRRNKGLGLHIMRYRANALGGDLKIEKRKRGGTSVIWHYPSERMKNIPDHAAIKRRGILVVDDHPLFRKGVVQMLGQETDLEVRAEAENASSALALLREVPVDLAIVDIGLHGSTNSIELTRAIRAEHVDVPVLVLSMHDESLYAERALRAGARGYLMKREALDSVIMAVRTVLNARDLRQPRGDVETDDRGACGRRWQRCPAVEKLTDRELEVLQLIGDGKEVRTIAQELHLSAKTVESHRAHIKEKLNPGANAREVVRFCHYVG